MNDYFNQLFILGEILFKGVIKLYKKDVSNSKLAFSRLKTLSTLRFNCYPNQQKPVEISKQDGAALGCETHVDSGVFTILYQDKKGGLQVQNRKTKKWHSVPHNKNALIVNTGMALQFLTKGKFKATNHRVLWNKTKRMSIPFFFEPSYDFKMNYSFLSKSLKNKGNNIFFYNLIVSLLNLNFKIATIGDKIKLGNIKNFGYSDKKTVNKIISLSKYAVGNRENLYSFFIQDCLKKNLTVFYNIEFKKYELFKNTQ